MNVRVQSGFCILCILICIALALFSVVTIKLGRKAPKPVQMVAQVNDTLYFEHLQLNMKKTNSKKNPKTIYPSQMLIMKGDVVTVLGVVPAETGREPKFWVEKVDGTRGLVCMDVLERIAVVTGKGKGFPLNRKDSVEILSSKRCLERASCATVRRLSDGQVFENIDEDMLTSPLTKKLLKRAVHMDAFHMINRDAFESKYMGKTFEETEALGIPAISVLMYNDTLNAIYPLKVFNPTSGKFFLPVVRYPKGNIATSYQRQFYKTHGNAWLLFVFPKVGWVFNMPWTAAALDKPLYRFAFPNYGTLISSPFLKFIVKLIGYLLIAALYLLWMTAWTWSMPMIFMSLAEWPIVYKFLPNEVLRIFIIILSVVWLYFCKAMIYSHVCWLIALPICVIALMFLLNLFKECVIDERCNKCKYLETIRKISYDLVDEYDTDWMPETKQGDLIDKRSRSWDTWTDVTHTTTTYQGGSEIGTSSYKTQENRKHHTETYRTYRMHDYLVRYHVKVYQTTYKCDNCGDLTYSTSKDRQKIDQQYVGSHTETRTSYSVQ